MDPGQLLVGLGLVLLPVIAGAIAGGVVSNWQAKAAERRSETRSAEAEARARAHYFADLERAELLAQIDQTELDYVAVDEFLIARVLGNGAGMVAARNGVLVYPKAQIYLISDVALLREIMAMRRSLNSRPFGAGLTDAEGVRMGVVRGAVMTILGVQRGRLLRGMDLEWLSTEDLIALQTEVLAEQGMDVADIPGPRPKPSS